MGVGALKPTYSLQIMLELILDVRWVFASSSGEFSDEDKNDELETGALRSSLDE